MAKHGAWATSIADGVAEFTFSRPPRNLMSMANMEDLRGLLQGVVDDDDVLVVLLSSSTPGYFVGHGDLEDLLAISHGEPTSGDPTVWDDTLRLIEAFPKPVIAAVDGQAWGGGLELTLACMVVFASDRAHFAFPEIDLGIIPGAGGTVRAPARMGVANAASMILTGRVVRADEARTMGLVQVVLSAEGFREAALEWCERVAAKPHDALRAATEALNRARGEAPLDALRHEALLFLGLQRGDHSVKLESNALALYAVTGPETGIDLSTL